MAAPTAREVVEAAEARRYEDFILDAYQTRREYLADYVARLDRLDSFLDGDWAVEFPDGRVVRDKPKIENGVLTKIEDTGMLAGNSVPTIRITPRNQRDENPAQEREQIIAHYWSSSQVSNLLPRWFMDLVGTGMAAVKVWPDFRQKDRAKRFPVFKRIDPRHMLPPLDYVIDGNTSPHDVITHRYVKTRSLIQQYPEQMAELIRVAEKINNSSNRGKRKDQQHVAVDISQVLVVEYWGADAIVMVAMVDGYPETRVTLLNEYNETECSPVSLAIRPTANGKIRGKVESMMPILAAENRLVTYILDYADQLVFAPLKKRGSVQNAEDFGPGAIIDLGPDGDIDRVAPATANPQLFQIMADLERHGRQAGNYPAARSGQVSQSIGSGNFVESLMGGLTTEVQTLQKVVEVMLMQANTAAMEQDVVYCDASKEISGMGQTGGYRLRYTPSESLRGKTDNFVTYGAAAGLDKFNAEIRLDQRARGGYVSKRWVREQMDGIESTTAVENEIFEEAALAAFMQGMLAKAAQGDLTAVAAFQMVLEQNQNPLLALKLMGEEALRAQENAQAPKQQPGPAAQPPTALGEATALKSGALPGTEEGLPAQGPGTLPPVAATVM